MPDGEETPGERPPREVERDLLAERRARRELGEPMLLRRAETAEATVRTLEAHLASLERRLHESVEERDKLTRALAGAELELRRVKQREHAEQQLRLEAEDHRQRIRRDTGAQIEDLRQQLAASRRRSDELGAELEQVRRELSEVQQSIALGGPLADWGESVHKRLAELERRVGEATQELARERQARHRAELELVRRSERDRRLMAVVRELVGATTGLGLSVERELRELAEVLRGEAAADEQAQLRGMAGLGAQIDGLRHELFGAVQALRSAAARRGGASMDTDSSSHAGLATKGALAGQSEQGSRLVGGGRPSGVSGNPEEGPCEASGAREPTAEEAESERIRRQAMADALAAAVERLRARVALIAETDERAEPQVLPAGAEALGAGPEALPAEPETLPAEPETLPAEPGEPLYWEILTAPTKRVSWLAPAIRAMAGRYGAERAGELIVALLPAQRLAVKSPVRYELRIEELGTYLVELDFERTTISKMQAELPAGELDFRLEGHAADLAELAGGGCGRRIRGVTVRGSKRSAKRLLKALRRPLLLADLALAGVDPPPELLLEAVGEAIQESWLAGRRANVLYKIEGTPGQGVQVQIAEGSRVLVQGEARSDEHGHAARLSGEEISATVTIDRRSLLHSLAGVQAPAGEPASVVGEAEAAQLLNLLAARAQGLRRGAR
jgi:hypothetical protein